MERANLLRELLNLERPLELIALGLKELPWDWDGPELVTLTAAHGLAVLERFLNGDLSADEVEEWANLIECREDVGFEPSRNAQLLELIHELANPLITAPLTDDMARTWIARLSAASGTT